MLSMQGLSYGVVRVDNENSLTSLTLQDCGQVLPGGKCMSVTLHDCGQVLPGGQYVTHAARLWTGSPQW